MLDMQLYAACPTGLHGEVPRWIWCFSKRRRRRILGDQHGKGKKGGGRGRGTESAPTLKKSEKSEELEVIKTEEGDAKPPTASAAAPAQELIQEAA